MTGRLNDTEGSSLSSSVGDPARARQLFRYLAGPEWREYRAIVGIFAGTFFMEFTPDEVAAKPTVVSTGVDPVVVPDRLESLRRWGNLTVSSSVGNPSSLDDYYRRRNRYLITRAGQEVYDITERVLNGIDQIADVEAGRLRDLNRALSELGDLGDTGFEHVESDVLADRVRTVFDVHDRFTSELTQFFAELNLWQNRYDLDADEVKLFAGVLVTYVSEQLREIERMVRPISTSLERILLCLPSLLPALHHGLAVRVEDAGLADAVSVRRVPGTMSEDWERLSAWFVARSGRMSRLDQLTHQAVAAVRTLTANVTRLSRIGLGAVSRRADFVRLASFFDQATSIRETHEIAAGAFGLGSCRRLGMPAGDADDPVPTVTPWRDAPAAIVPMSLRIRGSTGQRGRATPIRDRERERDLLRRRRELDRVERETAASDLVACADQDGWIAGASMSVASFSMLRDLISRSTFGAQMGTGVRSATRLGVRCEVRRVAGAETVVDCPEGRFVMRDMVVKVVADDRPDRAGAPT